MMRRRGGKASKDRGRRGTDDDELSGSSPMYITRIARDVYSFVRGGVCIHTTRIMRLGIELSARAIAVGRIGFSNRTTVPV